MFKIQVVQQQQRIPVQMGSYTGGKRGEVELAPIGMTERIDQGIKFLSREGTASLF